ncbi:MAG: DUF2764 domain-containing protein [Bacteroidales bacterium]|jgi:hypothetical protein|nr:DUF2764 domain-containing protein [Bacteroidales bacterium]
MNYYCLVAGLPDLRMDDTKGLAEPGELIAEITPQLGADDRRLLRLLRAGYDNRNFLRYLHDKDARLDPAGELTQDDWAQLVKLMDENDHPSDARLLPYWVDYYRLNPEDEIDAKGITREDYMSGLYYNYAMKADNRFLQQWFEFNLNLNNLLIAILCRKYEMDASKAVIGSNEIASILRTTHSRDFGIAGMFDQLELVMRLAEEPNLLEREKKLDALRWNWLEEHTFFNYFTVEKVLAFVLKTEMLHRWKQLSPEAGEKMFRDLLNSLKQGVKLQE